MPRVQRSPPAAVLPSAPQDLPESSKPITDEPNVSVRSKRPRLEDSFLNSELLENSLASDNEEESTPILKASIISALRKQIESTIANQLQASLKLYFENQFLELKNTLEELQKSVKFISNDYDDIKVEMSKTNESLIQLKKENDLLKTSVSDLSTRVNLLEQYSRQDNLEISGVPENQAENLTSMVLQLGKTVSCKIETTDILTATRVKKLSAQNNQPRSVIVKVRTTRIRDEILASVTKFNRTHATEKLNSSHLGYGGLKQPVFVSEHLSPLNKAIHAETRKIARAKGYKYVWVRDGKILLRKDDGSRAIHVKSLQALSLL